MYSEDYANHLLKGLSRLPPVEVNILIEYGSRSSSTVGFFKSYKGAKVIGRPKEQKRYVVVPQILNTVEFVKNMSNASPMKHKALIEFAGKEFSMSCFRAALYHFINWSEFDKPEKIGGFHGGPNEEYELADEIYTGLLKLKSQAL